MPAETTLRERLRTLFVPDDASSSVVAQAPALPVRDILRRFLPYARPERRWLPLLLLLVIAEPIIQTSEIWLFKLLIDDVLVPRDFGMLGPIAGAYVALTLIGGLVTFVDKLLSTWGSERFLLNLRTEFFRHLQGQSLDFFERRRLGDIVARVTGDVAAVESFLVSGVTDAIGYVLTFVIFTGALCYLNWQLALVSFVVVPFFWFAARRFSRLIKRASREKRRRSGSISAVTEESLANAALAQAYNRQEWEIARFHKENLARFHAEMTATRLRALFRPIVDLIETLGGLVVIGLGALALSRGHISLGGLLVFLTFLSRLYSPIRGMSGLVNTTYAASASAERIVELLDQHPTVREDGPVQEISRAEGVVEFDDVSFCYPHTQHTAVDRVSFCVRPGEHVALVGASGAGKSTLVKLLLRFYDPDGGRVLLDGIDLRALRLHALRDNVAVLWQETLIFDGTVRENIAYGREGATDR